MRTECLSRLVVDQRSNPRTSPNQRHGRPCVAWAQQNTFYRKPDQLDMTPDLRCIRPHAPRASETVLVERLSLRTLGRHRPSSEADSIRNAYIRWRAGTFVDPHQKTPCNLVPPRPSLSPFNRRRPCRPTKNLTCHKRRDSDLREIQTLHTGQKSFSRT